MFIIFTNTDRYQSFMISIPVWEWWGWSLGRLRVIQTSSGSWAEFTDWSTKNGMSFLVWLVVYLPLWKMWVRQLGWWNSQLNGKRKKVWNHQPVLVLAFVWILFSIVDDFVCTGRCILLKKVISKWSWKIDKRVYQETWGILTKLKREHRTYTQQKLNWIHSMHSLPEFPMFFPWFSWKKMTRLHRRPGFRFHLWHRPQRKGWDYIAWTILVGGFNPYEKCSKPPTSIISLIHRWFFMTLRWKPDMFLFMYLMLMLFKVSICLWYMFMFFFLSLLQSSTLWGEWNKSESQKQEI